MLKGGHGCDKCGTVCTSACCTCLIAGACCAIPKDAHRACGSNGLPEIISLHTPDLYCEGPSSTTCCRLCHGAWGLTCSALGQGDVQAHKVQRDWREKKRLLQSRSHPRRDDFNARVKRVEDLWNAVGVAVPNKRAARHPPHRDPLQCHAFSYWLI